MVRQVELVESVKAYDPGMDEDILNRAYVFAMKAHGSQTRDSGDPFFSHPLEVAGILTKFKLDTATIVTALLHDTIEDTDVTLEEIEAQFGGETARLVDGVTKLTRIEMQSEPVNQAENFRKLLLAMSDDIRVLLVKLADRLHNMRTLVHIGNPTKRRRIALETMDIYAPLAERMGMQEMKSELEDLAFAELNPEARKSILARLDFLRQEGGDLVQRIQLGLEETLANGGMDAVVFGREKTPYSVWHKMQRKNVGFEQLSDVMAFRVVVAAVEDCYRALGLIHSAYSVVPGRFKDYMSIPKPNGYRSIHTGVIGPEQQRIEIQIRTPENQEVAELGVAAHWIYKQGTGKTDGRQYRWLRELLDIMEQAASPEDFLEHTKLEMFQDQVFCFTPRGDLITLPRGATTVDFAYAVHSEVGNTCVGAKINGRIMPLRTTLRNGDQVEIITSKAQSPSPTWESFAVTGRARVHIRRFVRSQERAQYIELGRAILQRAFDGEGYEFTDKAIDGVLKVFSVNSAEDLFAGVGAGHQTGGEVVGAIFPGTKRKRMRGRAAAFFLPRRRKDKRKKKKPADDAIIIKGLIPGMAVHYAECCHPLPGDRIVGLVSAGKGTNIHTIDCETLAKYADEPERWLDVSWEIDDELALNLVGRVNLTVLNEPGSLGNLSTVIAKNDGNISNLKFTSRSAQFFEMTIDIEVRDVRHLIDIIAALRATPIINAVERPRG